MILFLLLLSALEKIGYYMGYVFCHPWGYSCVTFRVGRDFSKQGGWDVRREAPARPNNNESPTLSSPRKDAAWPREKPGPSESRRPHDPLCR